MIIKLVLICFIVFLISKFALLIGNRPIVYKICSVNEILDYIYILLYRGFTEHYSGDGRLLIKNLDNKYEIVLKKYKNKKNEIGIYAYFPMNSKIIKCKIEDFIKNNNLNDYCWNDNIKESSVYVKGIDIQDKVDIIVKLIKLIETENNIINKTKCLYSLFFINVSDNLFETIDYKRDEIVDYHNVIKKIRKPLTFKVYISKKIGDFYREHKND